MTNINSLQFAEPDGATPLDLEDVQGLIPTWVATRAELNIVEQENIITAMVWAFGRRNAWTTAGLLNRQALVDLHRRMFGEVWRWAGTWRRRETNIGVDPRRVVTDLENLLADVCAQTAHPSGLAWSPDEIAVRFHHRLVSIHPFANGNGRHARLATDLLALTLAQPRFTWGAGGDLINATAARRSYLEALRTADREFDYNKLLKFART